MPQWGATKPTKVCTACATQCKQCMPTDAWLEKVKELRLELATGGHRHKSAPLNTFIHMANTSSAVRQSPQADTVTTRTATRRPREQSATGSQGKSNVLHYEI